MYVIDDRFTTGTVFAARVSPDVLAQFEPVVRRLLSGSQLFVKLADGTYRVKGSNLGLTRCFEFEDLLFPEMPRR